MPAAHNVKMRKIRRRAGWAGLVWIVIGVRNIELDSVVLDNLMLDNLLLDEQRHACVDGATLVGR
jgi:hypothetical protein